MALMAPVGKEVVVSLSIPQRYTGVAIALHWLVAVLIFINIVLALIADDIPEGWQRPDINLHKSIGITVLLLAVMRLLWRLTHPAPAMPAGYKPWERRLAHAVHWILYALIFLMPLSGWLHDSAWKGAPKNPLVLFGVIPWFRIGAVMNQDPATKAYLHDLFGQIHTSIAYVIYAVVTLHILGALKHQFVDRDPELQRMLP